MATIIIKYIITEAAQKALAAAGQPAHYQREAEGQTDDLQIINLCKINTDGELQPIDTHAYNSDNLWSAEWCIRDRSADYPTIEYGRQYPYFEWLMTAEELIGYYGWGRESRARLEAEIAPARAEYKRGEEEKEIIRKKQEVETKERRACEEKEKAGKEKAAKEQLLLEAQEWIPSHGSERLKLALEHGLLEKTWTPYLEERLGVELPGWQFWDQVPGDDFRIVNPSLETLREFATKKIDGAELRYWKDEHEHDEDCEREAYARDEECPKYDKKCPCVIAQWRGKKIVYLIE